MEAAVRPDGSDTPAPVRRLHPLRGWLRATHVWFGLLTAVGVILVSVTGILLNHSAALGWGSKGPPPVEGTSSGDLAGAAPINDLLKAALREGVEHDVRVINDAGRYYPASGPSAIDRAVFRPGTATAQVRLKDSRHTEVTLDWSTAEVLGVTQRHDVRLDHLHSGEALGQRGVIISDLVAGALVLLTIGGAALYARRLLRRRPGRGRGNWWFRANWAFHLVAGMVAVAYTLVLCVTGVILNHKREWGFMDEPVQYVSDEVVARSEPASLERIVGWTIDARRRRGDQVTTDDVRLIDYRPLSAEVKVRFKDAETEVIVDAYEPEIFSISRRRDVWIEDLHSGVRFGESGWWLSDITAGLLILLTVNGLYLFFRPTYRRGAKETYE